jgi:hypothetical protein
MRDDTHWPDYPAKNPMPSEELELRPLLGVKEVVHLLGV